MRTRLLLVGIILPLTPLGASAQGLNGDVYIEVFGGLSDLSSTGLNFGAVEDDTGFDTGGLAGGALGYAFAASPVRAELEFTYRSADGSDVAGDFASTTLALNGYYDFGDDDARLRPYIGAGVGVVTEIDYDIADGIFAGEYSDRGGALFQGMLGASYAITPSVLLSGELRYFDAGSRTLSRDGGGSVDTDYSGAEVTLGLAYRF
ncbi:outer membrane protein [Jannaschia donghaensis]|uniref:Adhesin/invasin protein PagN n=1 Tax=Jannaschia donghaensis TaxID=420998 RepID=A0A0M6YIX9_9RHOB|nr:outer membrane beta-barrel protein [Jannaschia donghaensis]CTQ49463.1 Adhesin/invasin protein PagN [Jannaschia donghaensis]